jgi:hypothetical protein
MVRKGRGCTADESSVERSKVERSKLEGERDRVSSIEGIYGME